MITLRVRTKDGMERLKVEATVTLAAVRELVSTQLGVPLEASCHMDMDIHVDTLAPRLTVKYTRVMSVPNMQTIRILSEMVNDSAIVVLRATPAGVRFPNFYSGRCWLPIRYFCGVLLGSHLPSSYAYA